MNAFGKYTSEDFTTTIPLADYLARYRDSERIAGYCRTCPNFGRSWCCPPFDSDAEQWMRPYDTALLLATKIIPTDTGRPLSEAERLIRPERERIERKLLAMERRCGGRAFTAVGTCLCCPEGTCTRPSGKPCRHPDRVRPSLEACGFDIDRTLSELFGISLKWGAANLLPEYLMLVSGFFHNSGNLRWNG